MISLFSLVGRLKKPKLKSRPPIYELAPIIDQIFTGISISNKTIVLKIYSVFTKDQKLGLIDNESPPMARIVRAIAFEI